MLTDKANKAPVITYRASTLVMIFSLLFETSGSVKCLVSLSRENDHSALKLALETAQQAKKIAIPKARKAVQDDINLMTV